MGTYVSAGFNIGTWNSGMTQANYNLLCTNVASALAGAGLVQTSDTGQADPATTTNPGSNANSGYVIYRFADSVQGTDPLFIKMFFGRGNNSTSTGFRLQIQIGQGSNGSGTLTGGVSDLLTVNSGNYNVTNSAIGTTYAFHDEGVFWLANYGNFATQAYPPLNYFCIARTRNQISGAFDGRGALIHYTNNAENRAEQYFYNWTTGRKHQSTYGTYQYCLPIGSLAALPSGEFIAWPHFYIDDGVIKKAWATWTVATSQLATGVNTFTASPYGSPRLWWGLGQAGRNIRGLGISTNIWATVLPWAA